MAVTGIAEVTSVIERSLRMNRRIIVAVGFVCMAAVAAIAAEPRTGEPLQPVEAVKTTNAAKVELGKKLFFDPRLSRSGFISCNSCHNLATGGVDNLPSSIGHKWQLGPINSPTVLNSKYNVAQFWDGRAKDLKEQAAGPIENPAEMAATHELAIEVLRTIPGYVAEFKKVYGTDKITIGDVTDAIAVFEETLVTPDSRFDKWLKGDDNAITKTESQGYDLFKAKGCTTCHMGIAVGASLFQKMGLVKPYETDNKAQGRYDVTGQEADRMVFKVPTLRNVELTYPYFHDGSLWDLKDAVKTMADIQLGIPVNDQEADKIVAFLLTLTGELPEITIPLLPPSTPQTPQPDRM
jgi:cytochrome c peroxidase